jgi:hypothetical protein
MENLLAGRDYRRRTPAPQPALLVDEHHLASLLRPIQQHTAQTTPRPARRTIR